MKKTSKFDSAIEASPEIKSYIYQQLVEFEPFITENTKVAVLAKNPLSLALQLETDGNPIPKNKLKEMHRISISLIDGEARIEAEGLHENIYEAIRIAKGILYEHLSEIQDNVLTKQERMTQIQNARIGSTIH